MTKFRRKVFTDAHLTRLEEITRAVAADFEQAERDPNDLYGVWGGLNTRERRALQR